MLVLFDYDGVIADSFEILLEICVRAQKDVPGGRAPDREDFRTLENLTFPELGRRIGLAEERIPEYCARVLELQREDWQVALFPGMVSVMRELAGHHIIGVVTASQGEAVAGTLRANGLGRFVSDVLGGERGDDKSARIDALRKKHGVASGDTLMVGDTISDIREGRRAGVRTVAVAWGYQDCERLLREHPDFLIARPRDLLKIVR